jgi:hypothetical protein
VPVRAGQPIVMRAGSAAPSRSASQDSAVLLALGVNGAERRCGECSEDAWMGANAVRDALAAGEPGAEELVGVCAVDLCAGRAAGCAAGLARDGQDAARSWTVV